MNIDLENALFFGIRTHENCNTNTQSHINKLEIMQLTKQKF
jgi:hypothetical protein